VPGKRYASLQNPAAYEALRRKGLSKEKAAKFSNAQAPGHTVKRRKMFGPGAKGA
jgi:hypothetical protein